MLKLKTKISLFGIVVLWLMCSQASSKKNWRGWGWGGSGSDKGSFADVSLDDPLTLLASYVAAPVVLAVAALHELLRIWVVATAAAHQITAVTASRGLVALPGVSMKRRHWIRFSSFCSTGATLLKTFPESNIDSTKFSQKMDSRWLLCFKSFWCPTSKYLSYCMLSFALGARLPVSKALGMLNEWRTAQP